MYMVIANEGGVHCVCVEGKSGSKPKGSNQEAEPKQKQTRSDHETWKPEAREKPASLNRGAFLKTLGALRSGEDGFGWGDTLVLSDRRGIGNREDRLPLRIQKGRRQESRRWSRKPGKRILGRRVVRRCADERSPGCYS